MVVAKQEESVLQSSLVAREVAKEVEDEDVVAERAEDQARDMAKNNAETLNKYDKMLFFICEIVFIFSLDQ